MKRGLQTLSVALITTFTLGVEGRPLTVREKLSDFNQINGYIESSYGPLKYKGEKLGVDLDKLQEKYRVRVVETQTNSEFYYLIREYVAEFHDGHFMAFIPSEQLAFIPAMTELIQGKVLVDAIDRRVPAELVPFKKGDEIVTVDGKPVLEVVNELKKYVGSGFSQTELREATWFLFYRPTALLPIPQGRATVGYKSRGSDEVKTATLDWMYFGEPLDEFDGVKSGETVLRSLQAIANGKIDYRKLSSMDMWKAKLGSRIEASYQCSGNTRIQVPLDATVVTSGPFVSYYHSTPFGSVGYLRIPHYSPEGPNAESAIAQYFAQYEYAISVLEKNTVGLIIDQDHNCGGYVQLVDQMVSLFVDKPYAPAQFQLLASKAEYLGYRNWLSMIPQNTLAFGELEKVADLIKTSWQSGEYLTAKTSLSGDTLLYPNRVRYTKPVLMLIDELSGSGGDLFPSLMQGYGRAKLLGTRTSGLGGHVEPMPPLHFSQINLQLTKSLFYRPDGVAVENNGATPDYPYALTVNDFMNGYQEYQAYYLKVLGEMVKK